MPQESRSAQIRLLVVDDHPLIRAGITALVETESDLTITAEAHDGSDASYIRPLVNKRALFNPG